MKDYLSLVLLLVGVTGGSHLYYDRKLLVSCSRDDDCFKDWCCKDHQCTFDCGGVDESVLVPAIVIPLIFLIFGILVCFFSWRHRTMSRRAMQTTTQVLNTQAAQYQSASTYPQAYPPVNPSTYPAVPPGHQSDASIYPPAPYVPPQVYPAESYGPTPSAPPPSAPPPYTQSMATPSNPGNPPGYPSNPQNSTGQHWPDKQF